MLPFLAAFLLAGAAGAPPLRLSVYATAGGVNRYLETEAGREQAVRTLRRLGATKIFLEGRRGDEYVPPGKLRAVRDFLRAAGFETAGGIATVPGKTFGVRQQGPLAWLNYQNARTQRDVARFFTENAALFEELIVDDFYCTADVSEESERARGSRSWGEYRRDLMVSLMEPAILRPARAVRPEIKLILKYPQWYDRFHLFGYDPPRMSPRFDRIWVGTEVRNPKTRRMGFVQPVEGYMNFRWLASVSGGKTEGAWFDHIESTARNFVDQAWQSVLAGAKELTLFSLLDVMEGHPGHDLLIRDLPEMNVLAARLRNAPARGIAYYKPPGGDSEENLYLMDYLGMLGLPVAPAARYPEDARVVFLGVQAAGDPDLGGLMQGSLKRGATLVLTPAALRKLGAEGRRLAGVTVTAEAQPGVSEEGLEVDLGLAAPKGSVILAVRAAGREIPLLCRKGRVLVWNVRTFSEQDFRDTGEHLLAPKALGIASMPQPLLDRVRAALLEPLGLRFSAPAGVALYWIGDSRWLYNFGDGAVAVRVDGRTVHAPPGRAVEVKRDAVDHPAAL